MSAVEVRETLQEYVSVLLERGDYGRFFDDAVEVSIVGTDQKAVGPEAAEQMIRFIHEVAFDARPEVGRVTCDESGAAAEAVFVATHTGEFAGVPARGNHVRVPYSAFYDVSGGKITALRLYMSLDELVRQISQPSMAAAPAA